MEIAPPQIVIPIKTRITIYAGAWDKDGHPITADEARRIVQEGKFLFYSKNLRRRITVSDYTRHIQSRRQQWTNEGYPKKQIKEQLDRLKAELPAATWSGLFSMARRAELITQHSGLITADVDKLTAPQILGHWKELVNDPRVWLLFHSPSETGLKIVVPVAGLGNQWPVRPGMPQLEYTSVANPFHQATYLRLRNFLLEEHGLEIDGACTDSSRLCYLPYDAEAFFNSRAEPLAVPWSKQIEQQIHEATQRHDPGRANGGNTPPPTHARTEPGENVGPFQELPDGEQERLIESCLGALNPDVVPAGFGDSANPGDRHRWDTSVGMALHAWDAKERGLQKYLAWGANSAHKSEIERACYWRNFNGKGSISIATLLKFGCDAGVNMPWAGQKLRSNEEIRTAALRELPADDDHEDEGKVGPLAVRGLMEFADLPSDTEAVLLGDRWLDRKSAALVIAPSGVGKSTFIAQASALWSLGQPAFGIKPSKALCILCFQAEDDDFDIREIAAGIKNS